MTDHAHHHQAGHGQAVDPVCGMKVDPAATAHHATHAGEAFHFCSAGCRQKFEADPSRYLSPAQAKQSVETVPEGPAAQPHLRRVP